MRPIFASFFILLVIGAGITAAHAQDTSAADARSQRLIVRALTHLQTGNGGQAIDALDVALGLRPGDAAILSMLAEAHRMNGDLPAAVYYAEAALDAAPSADDTVLGLADVLAASGDTDSAADLLEAHAHRGEFSGESNAEFTARAVRLLNAGGGGERALSFGILAIDRGGYQARVLSALADLPARHRDAVAERLTDVLSEGRLSAANKILAAEWIRDHGSDEAREWAIASINSPNINITGINNTFDADAVISAILSQSPHQAGPGSIGRADAASPGDPTQGGAADFWLERIEDDPRQESVWERASEQLLAEGRADEAQITAEEATLLFPGNARLRSLLGMAMLDAGNPHLALPYLDVEKAAGALALAQVLLDREQDAREALRRFVIQEFAAEQIAYATIANAMMGHVPDELEMSLTEAADRLADHVIMREAVGWLLYAAGDDGAAAEAFEDAAGLGGHLSRFREPLIDLYERANRVDEAAALRTPH